MKGRRYSTSARSVASLSQQTHSALGGVLSTSPSCLRTRCCWHLQAVCWLCDDYGARWRTRALELATHVFVFMHQAADDTVEPHSTRSHVHVCILQLSLCNRTSCSWRKEGTIVGGYMLDSSTQR